MFAKIATYGKIALPGMKHGFPYATTPDHLKIMGTDFLSKALGATVKSFNVETTDTLEGNGMVSAMVHGDINMADGTTKSVVYKFGPASFQSRITCDIFALAETEFQFYTSMTEKVPLRVPKLLYGDFNTDSKNVCLIQEKITYARFRDVMAPGTSSR